MNAYELAGLMELAPTYIQYRQEAATMLRQLQAENEALKAHQYERPHNTVLVPCDKLAEMQAENKELKTHLADEKQSKFKPNNQVNFELTDEEIEQIASQYLSAHAQFIGAGECSYEGEIEFARAILRKAQER